MPWKMAFPGNNHFLWRILLDCVPQNITGLKNKCNHCFYVINVAVINTNTISNSISWDVNKLAGCYYTSTAPSISQSASLFELCMTRETWANPRAAPTHTSSKTTLWLIAHGCLVTVARHICQVKQPCGLLHMTVWWRWPGTYVK